MLMTAIILLAIIFVTAILLYALHQNRDVKFNVKVPGANVSLETRGRPVSPQER